MKKLTLPFAAALLAATSLLAPRAQAQASQKIGYASVEYILGQMPESKQIESDLKAYGSQMEGQLKTKYQDYQTKLDAFQKLPPTTSDVIKQDKAKELQSLQQSIQEFQQNAQQSVQQRQGTALRPVLDKIQKNIDAVAEESGYAYILNSDAGGTPVLLHGPKDGDVSDMVLKKMGITPTKEAPAPAVRPAANTSTVPPAPARPTGTKRK